MSTIGYPFDNVEILRKKKTLKRQLFTKEGLMEKRIAILSGSTIGDIKDILELFLLDFDIKPQFYIGQYHRYFEDIMFENQDLIDFKPDLIYIHTSIRNVSDSEIMDKLRTVWKKIKEDYACPIVQNNFELPIDSLIFDRQKINELNIQIADYERENRDFYVNDIQYLSAVCGLSSWFHEQDYFLYKYAFSVSVIPMICHNIAKIIKSIYPRFSTSHNEVGIGMFNAV